MIGHPDFSQSRIQRRLARCASVEDVRALAKSRTPRAVFDYTDGSAMSESTLARSRAAYARVEFTPRVLRNVAEVDLSVTMLGQVSALPFALAPTGFTRMMHHTGEQGPLLPLQRNSGCHMAFPHWELRALRNWPNQILQHGGGFSYMYHASVSKPNNSCIELKALVMTLSF